MRQREVVLPLLKRHEIQVLRRAGHSQAEVAQLAGVSIKTVRRVEQEEPVTAVDDRAEAKRRRIGRPSKAEPFRELVTKLLGEDPEMISLEILRRARLAGYSGKKSALYGLVAALRPTKQTPIVRFEGLPGEFSQHDFGQVDVRYVDDSRERIHFFASRLKYSRWVAVTIVSNEQTETLVRTLAEHFTAFGGVPLLAVFDQPKTVALGWKDGAVTEWNPIFAQAVLELGVGVELCWPARGNQKGSVENLVGWVKGSFFKPRRFVDREDLAQQLAEWHVEVNTQTPSRATRVTPMSRMEEERARLRPLKVEPNELAIRVPISVAPTGLVLHETNEYSMPPESIGRAGTLFLYKERVRIVAGIYEATHDRLFGTRQRSILQGHRTQMAETVRGARAKQYYKREQIAGLGADAQAYLTELVHRRSKTWTRDVDALFEILEQQGDESLRNAISMALSEGAFGAEYVRHFIQAAEHRPRQRASGGRNRAARGSRKGRARVAARIGQRGGA
jgi:transposase